MTKLTDKQDLFFGEYLIDLNATQAAIRTGYTEKTSGEQGARLLTNVKVINYSDGRFRGNWQVTFDVPATGELDRIDPTGMETLKDGIEQIEQYTCSIQSIYFTNNVPYSVCFEFGHSKQAPNDIVRVAILMLQHTLKTLQKEVNS